jgi:release factor glutamine methyltransferase
VDGHLTPAAALREGERYLAGRGVEAARAEAEALLRWVLRTDRAGLYARRRGLTEAAAGATPAPRPRRGEGVPLQYVTGEQRFLGLDLEVAPGVFIPRPETEVLVEAALEVVAGRWGPLVVDVGTGTGAVALALKRRRPDARVLATDVSPEAVRLARRNARRLGLRVQVLEGDLLSPVPPDLRGRVDLLVSNPPYVTEEEAAALPPEVRAEPREALVGGTALHRRLVEAALDWLAPGGWLVVEVGANQGEEVAGLFRARLESVAVLPDLAGRDRVVRGRRGSPPRGPTAPAP